jgi:hypothetical protein
MMSENLIINGGFESDWGDESSHRILMIEKGKTIIDTVAGNIFCPPGWIAWSRVGGSPEYNLVEMVDAHKIHDAVRVHSGEKAIHFFKLFGHIDAGLMQRVYVGKGNKVRLDAFGQCWSNDKQFKEAYNECYTNAHCSAGIGPIEFFRLRENMLPETGDPWNDAAHNMYMQIGIDPQGRLNPYAGGIVWGNGAHSYNAHHPLPSVTATAESDYVTVILRSKSKWAFKNTDAYFDDVSLIIVDEPVPPPPEDEIEVYIRSAIPRVGDTITAVATSHTELSNVTLNMVIDGKDFPLDIADSGEDDDGYFWSASFTVNDEGLHTITAECDTCSDTMSFEVLAKLPGRGDPRVQYERTYVLLPPNAGADWAAAVAAATWNKHRYTVGGSADDAGIGDLDKRRVIAINPDRWSGPQTLEDFFAQYYPGAIYEPVYADTPEQLKRLLGLPAPNPNPPPAPSTGLLVGLHDEAGGYWVTQNGIEQGVCLVHRQVQTDDIDLDYTHLQSNGQTVICRLNWGYADGTGTLPPFDGGLDEHIDALADTMNNAKGVDYFHFANEPNNKSEWPSGAIITVEQVIYAYNKLCGLLNDGVKIGPPPLDPYFGPGSDNGYWWRTILSEIVKADVIFLHTGKTQTNDPALVYSEQKFTHAPLQWQYLNFLATQTYLNMIPERFKALPVYITECNPQHLDAIGGPLGWKPDNAQWVEEAARLSRTFQQIKGIVFYRYDIAGDQSGFGLADKPDILGQIVAESRR